MALRGTQKARICVDCLAEGIVSKRKAPHPGPRCATHHRAKRKVRSAGTWAVRILALYGLTPEEFWGIFRFQGNRCAICERATGARKRLSVDHCHTTGQVRGLLCGPCNKMLGHARDEVGFFERAISYLKEPPAESTIGWRRVPVDGAPVKART